jgi:dTDP-4-dehydrorhamnose reductase
MILLLGATGYIGQAFARELRRRGECFIPLSRSAFDYTCFEILFDYVRKIRPEFVINAAGAADKPFEVASEIDRLEVLQTNTLVPQTVARVCVMTNTPWAHLSSSSIYSGAKIYKNGEVRVERDLGRPEISRHFYEHPEHFLGFTERDEPNFCFRHPPCSFYSGTKALAEEAIQNKGQNYIWRLGVPFNEQNEPCNWLSQVQRSPWVHDMPTSLSHLEDCVRACLELWRRCAPFGIYNIANPRAVTTNQVVELIQRILKPNRKFKWWNGDKKPLADCTKVPRSSCILDASKLLNVGVRMRGVKDALEESLEKWQTASPRLRVLASPSEVE